MEMMTRSTVSGSDVRLGYAFDSVDVVKLRIDGIKPSPIAEISHAAEHPGKSAHIRTGGADHGDGFGMGHDVESGANFRRSLSEPAFA